jgi:DNA polymerase V
VNAHGGRREGAGRPAGTGRFGGEPTIVKRLPPALYERALLAHRGIPAFAGRLPAGSPNAIDELAEERCDLQEWLVRNPESTVLYTVTGDSMDRAGIFDGDRVLVDRALMAEDGDIVVAFLSGDGSTVKRLRVEDGVPVLHPESTNSRHQPHRAERTDGFSVLGVVTSVIRQFRRGERRIKRPSRRR